MLTKEPPINKYLDEKGRYNPLLSDNIKETYKEINAKKEIAPKKILDHNPISRLINRIFKFKAKSHK